MKKKLLSILLCLCMVATLLPTVALAAGTDISGTISTSQTWNGTNGDVISAATTITGGTESEPIVITVTGTVTVKATITIDSSAYVKFTGGGTLKRDSGFINDKMLHVKSGNLTVENITIDGGNITTTYEAILVKSGGNGDPILNFNSGAVLKSCVGTGNAGGIYLSESGTFNMSGGSITSNTAYSGGGVYVNSGVFNMSGGSITSNTARFGGGVYVNNGVFNMSGGSITSNTAYSAGGVYVDGPGNFKIFGTPVISNNTGNSLTSNVYLLSNKTITVVETGLSGGASIGVTTETAPIDGSPVAITSTCNADYSNFFHSDNSNYGVMNDANIVKLYAKAKETTPTTPVFTATGADSGTLSSVSTGLKYSTDGGSSWTDITSAESVSIASGVSAANDIQVVKKSTSDTTIDSDPQIIDITTADTPNLAATQPSTIGGTGSIPTTTAHEFSSTSATEDFTACTDATTGLAAGTYYVRVKAIDTVLTSDAQTINIIAFTPQKNPTPTADFSAGTMKLTGVSSTMKYEIDSGGWQTITGTEVDLSSTVTGTCTIQVYQPGNGSTTTDSNIQNISITKATTPTTAGKEDCSGVGSTGKLTGVTALMEYQKSGAGSWTTGTSDGTITGLAAGTYYVRVKATGTVLASDNQTLTIAAYVPKTDKAITAFSIGDNEGSINEDEHTIAVTVPYGTDVTSLTPTITVSDKATVSPQSGTAQNFTSPVTYTVTAEDTTSTQDYIVTVTVADPKLTSVTAPSARTLTAFYETSSAVCDALPSTVTIKAEDAATTLPCVWSYTGSSYNKNPGQTNSFHWVATTTDYDVNGQTVSGDVTITNRAAAQLTITAPTFIGKTYDGTTNVEGTVTPGTVGGKLDESDVVNVAVASATYDNPNAGTSKTITVVYAIEGADAWKYIKPADYTSATGVITAKPLTLASATATNRDYVSGNTVVAISAVTFTESAPVPVLNTGFTVAGAMENDNAGTGKSVTATVTLTDTNYSLATSTVATTVNIAKIAYAGTTTDTTSALRTSAGEKTYTMPSEISTLAGVGYEVKTKTTANIVDTAAPTFTGNVLGYTSKVCAGTDAKSDTITITVSSTNYSDFDFVLTVNALSKTDLSSSIITSGITGLDKTYNGVAAAYTGSATVTDHTNLNSSLVYEYQGTGTTSYNKNATAPTNAGTYKLIVSIPDNNDYVGSAEVSFSIGKKPVTAPAADNTVFTYTGQAQTYGISATADYTVTGNTQTNANESGYSVTVALKDKNNTVWDESHDTADKSFNFIIRKAALTITADDKSIAVGAEKPTYTATPVGLANGETLSGVTFTDTATDTNTKGSFPITPAGGTASGGNANYTITYIPGTLTINIDVSVIDTAITAANTAKTGVTVNEGEASAVTSGAKFVKQTVLDALNNAIQTATAAKLTVTTAAQAQAAATTLDNAVTAFKAEIKTGTYVAPSSGGGSSTPTTVTEIRQGAATPADNLSRLISAGKTLTVTGTNGAKLVFDTTSLKGIDAKTSGSVTVKIEDVSKAHQDMAGKNVFSLTVESGGKTVTDFGGSVTVTLPYTLKDGEKAEDVSVWYLASDGTMTELPCTYDAKTGLATFTVSHFSEYVVGVDAEWANPFSDVKAADWFYGDVAYVAAKGLMSGTGGATFAPHAATSRGMIVTILYRLEGQPTVTGATSFDDVAAGAYYERAIIWAAQNSIVGGYGNGKFGPDDDITREQMAAILYRYAAFKGYDMTATADLSKFADADKIGTWATTALSWANAGGLVTGKGNGILDPQGNAERCQVAAILHRFCENVVK